MKNEVITELNFLLKKNKKTITELAKYCEVSRPTMTNLVNSGEGSIDLLEKARNFFKQEVK